MKGILFKEELFKRDKDAFKESRICGKAVEK